MTSFLSKANDLNVVNILYFQFPTRDRQTEKLKPLTHMELWLPPPNRSFFLLYYTSNYMLLDFYRIVLRLLSPFQHSHLDTIIN